MFPYRDDNPTLRTPVITMALIVANVLVWVFVQGMGSDPALASSICRLGLVPGEFLHRIPAGTEVTLAPGMVCQLGTTEAWHTPLTSMFLHGGWLHLIGNMWFLWVFGNNVEDSMGRARFLAFYVLCGLAGAALEMFLRPTSSIPMVGASGAISGVMGAYIVLYPFVRVHMFVFLLFIITTFRIPAWVMLGYWLLVQILGGLPALGRETGGTAFWAHVGGFAAGALLILFFQNREYVAQHRAVIRRQYYGAM